MRRLTALLLMLTMLPLGVLCESTVIEPVYETPENVQLLLQVADEEVGYK